MHKLDPQARPSVDQETLSFLQQMRNSGVFKIQYDAWAFAVALALRDGLSPAPIGTGKEQLAHLSTLDDEIRFALEQAALVRLANEPIEDFVEYVNGLAQAGLKEMQAQMKDLSISERIKWVLST